MGSRRERVLAVALVVLTALLASLGAPADDRGGYDLRPSTFRVSPNGAAALYLVLEELEIPVDRRLAPLADADSIAGPLSLLAPTEPPTPTELDALVRWIEAGGTLLYVARPGDPTLRALGLGDVRRLDAAPGDRDASRAGAVAAPVPHRWTEGAEPVPGFRWAFHDTVPVLRAGTATPLLRTDDGAVVALTWRQGLGTVLAWSDAAPLRNRALRESGAPVVFVRAAAEAADGRPLIFDEYHHRYHGRGSATAGTLRFLRDAPAGHAVLQLALAGAGLLLLLGWRFGAPVPPAAARRRSPLEHVDALAELYRQAAARGVARRLLLAQLARRLGRRPPRGPGVVDGWLDDLAAGLRHGREQAVEVRAEWRRGERADLVALARSMDRLLTEVKRS